MNGLTTGDREEVIELTASGWKTIAEEAIRERDEAREKIGRQAARISELEGATNHAGGTPLTMANERIERCLRDIEAARADINSLLGLVADIRAAVGDRTGKLMQDELIEHCRKLYEEKKTK